MSEKDVIWRKYSTGIYEITDHMLEREEVFPDSSSTRDTWCQRRSIGE